MPATKATDAERMARHSYAHVEAAIARVFGLKEADGKLKGRIQHMRRLGLTPPSDGGPVAYDTTDWPDQWIIGLELEYAGLDPITAVQFVQRSWRPHRDLQAARDAVNENAGSLTDIVDVARAVRGKSSADRIMLTVTFTGTSNKPEIGYFFVPGSISFAQYLCGDDEPRRAAVIPLSTRLRQLDRELGISRTVEKYAPGSLLESLDRYISRDEPKGRAGTNTDRDGKKRRAKR
jgi:hypothetical protein